MLGSIDPETLATCKQHPFEPQPHPVKCGDVSRLESWRRTWMRNLAKVNIERYLVWFPPHNDAHTIIIEHDNMDAQHRGKPCVRHMVTRMNELLVGKMQSWQKAEDPHFEASFISQAKSPDSCAHISTAEAEADWKFFI